MAGEIVTTGVLRFDTSQAEKDIAALDRLIDDLFEKAKRGGGVGPLFGGGRGGGGRGGGAPPIPVPDTTKLQKALDLQSRINLLMREAGVTYGAASTVARAYGDSMDGAGDEALDFARKIDKAKRETKDLATEQRRASGEGNRLTQALQGAGRQLLGTAAATVGVVAILGAMRRTARESYDSFTELQSAFVALRKVVNDLDPAQLSRLRSELENLSTSSVPIATTDLIQYGAVAAQIGIQSASGIRLAAETAAQLAAATDLSGEVAVKSLARILALNREGEQSLDNLGSALVVLGNTSRATEAEIEPVANEIARATANYQLGSPTVLGYAAALAEMGAKAEGSGTALATLLKALLTASKTGKSLEEFAEIAGVTTDELKALADKNLSDAAIAFLTGLRRYGKEGSLELDKVGLGSQRVGKALVALAANSDRLADRIAVSNQAFDENTALSQEAAAAFGQLKADVQRAENAIRLLLADAFEPFAPLLSAAAAGVVSLATKLRESNDVFERGRFLLDKYAEATDSAAVSQQNLLERTIEQVEAQAKFQEILLDIQELEKARSARATQPIAAGAEWRPAFEQKRREEVEEYDRALANARKTLVDYVEGLKEARREGKLGEFLGIDKDNAQAASDTVDEVATSLKTAGDVLAEVKQLEASKEVDSLVRSWRELLGEAAPGNDVLEEAAEKLLAQEKALKKTAEAARKYSTEEERNAEELKEVRKLFQAGAISAVAMAQAEKDLAPPEVKRRIEALAKAQEQVNTALREVRQADDALLLMRDFGVDAGVAREAVKLLAEDGIELSTEAAIELAQKLRDSRDAVSDLAKERKSLDDFRRSIEDINREAELVTQGLSLQDAADAIRLMETAGVDAATAISMLRERTVAEMELTQAAFDAGRISVEQYMQAMLSPEKFEQWRKNQQDAARIIDGLKTKLDKYAEETARINDLFASGDLTEEQRDAALKSLRDQQEGWVRVAAAAAEAAANTEGAWSTVFSWMSDNIQTIAGVFQQLSGIAAARGDTQNAQLLGAAGSFAQGDWGSGAAGLAQGLGLTGGGTSQFGGRREGNMMAEGAQLGNAIWPGWGALIGAVVGAFVKTGADDFHSEMVDAGGKAELSISQAEGELGKVGEKMSAFFNTFLNEMQAGILADLDLGGAQIHIREDRVRVVSNGIEKVFHDLEEGMDFFIRGILQANATVDGLGENVRAFFEGANQFSQNLGDLEKLQAGLELAQRLDFDATGIDTRAINAYREELKLAAEFRIPLEKVVALRQKEIAALKDDIASRARGMLGASDFASPVIELTRGMEVFNNTATKQAEVDRQRVEELQRLIAAGEESAAVSAEEAQAASGATAAHERFRDGIGRDREAMGEFTAGVDDATRAHRDSIFQLQAYREELDALNATLEEPPDTFAQEEFGRLWEKAVADAGLSLLDMIEAVEGPTATVEKRREFQHATFMLQLFAQIQAAELVLQTMVFVSEASRALFEGVVEDAKVLFEDLASGAKSLNLGGGGRRNQERKRAEEEAERAAKASAERLDEFTRNLRTLELNASSASGTLGDLAARLDEIAEAARGAAEAGASPEEVRRMQQLSLREERDRLLAPFQDTRPENFATRSIDIEQQRRDALDQARAIAMAQSEALGVSFDVLFDGMAEDINRGADRMQAELNRSVVDALNLPLEGARREMQAYRAALRDLDLAYQRGEISTERYRDLQEQIQAQQAAAVGSQALSLLDRYYSEVEGQENLRRDLERANFEIELATLRLRFNALVAENALAQETIDTVGGFLNFMENNPPDWDAFFAPPPDGISVTGGGGGGGGGFSSASIAADFSNLADAIRDFVHGFNQVDVGHFTAQARDWLKALDDFNRDIAELLAENSGAAGTIRQVANSLFGITDITQLTAEQLQQIRNLIPATNIYSDAIDRVIDVLSAAGDLDDIAGDIPDRILSMYEGTVEETNQLAGQYAAINEEFADAMQALQESGASAEQLAAAETIHLRRVLAFWEEALSGLRSLSEELRGGSFGGVNLRDQITSSEARIAELRDRLAQDPEDFDALQQLEAELRNLLGLQQEFTGGVGPEFDRIVAEILGLSDSIISQLTPDPELLSAPPELLDRMDAQSIVFQSMDDRMREVGDWNRQMVDGMNVLIAQNAALLSLGPPTAGLINQQ